MPYRSREERRAYDREYFRVRYQYDRVFRERRQSWRRRRREQSDVTLMTVQQYKRRMTEDAMRVAITELVELHGGRVFFVHDSRRAPSMADWPDLVILLPHRRTVVFVELKSQLRKVTDGQRAVMATLAECPRAEAFVVRPVPRDGELSYDSFLEWLKGEAA